MKATLRIILASALITAAAIKVTPALAEQPAEAETRVSFVRTADLDLSSKAGVRQLDERLAQAAREVCGTASDVDLEGKNEVRRCRDETIARARQDKGNLIASSQGSGFFAVTAAR